MDAREEEEGIPFFIDFAKVCRAKGARSELRAISKRPGPRCPAYQRK